MSCRRCQQGRTDHGLERRRCAWDEQGNFDRDNWCCETLIRLRQIAADYHAWDLFHARCEGAGSIAVVRDLVNEDGWLVLVYYKDRGTTEVALLVNDEADPAPVTQALAEAICDAYDQQELGELVEEER